MGKELIRNHWCLAPLISRIYETRLTGSELKWGKSAAHKIEVQALVCSSEKIFLNLFLGFGISCTEG